jgi:hypothetical protein
VIRVGDDADSAEKRIIAHGGKRVIVPLAPALESPPVAPDGKIPANWKPRPAFAQRVYELARGHRLVATIETGRIVGLTEERFPDGPRGAQSVQIPGQAGEPAGDWIQLLADQPAYHAKPGEEQVFTGRLNRLRPITELQNFAYELAPGGGTKERFTLGVGLLPALEKLNDAALEAGGAPVVQVRGKVEKDVQLYKGDGGKGVILWPAAIRLVAGPGAAPGFSAKCQRPDDTVVAAVAGGMLVLTVTSPGGIGFAEVKPEKGEWPKKVTVRLALKGLEGFSAECGGKKLSGSINSSGDRGGDLAAEKKGDYIEVALPEGFAAGADAGIKLSWVDFYR